MWLVVVCFTCPTIYFCFTLLYHIPFSPPVTICFKNGMISLQVENYMWKYGQEIFFCLTYAIPQTKVIKTIAKLLQMIFNAWFGYFEYTGYLQPGVTLVILNKYLDLIATNFNCSTWPRSIGQQEISSQNLYKPLLTHSISHSTFSIHWTNLFFFQLHFYLSWIKHNILKMLLFSSIFNIKMATQKFTNFDFF